MRKLQIFKNQEFGDIRTVAIGNEPWFVGFDVAGALGYKNQSDALAKHVSDEDKRVIQKSQITTFEYIPNRGLTFVNESGLYALIFGSKLESAKRFKNWVTSEVLPAIRKHGGYIVGQDTLSDEELLAKALLVAQSKIEENRKQIERMKPKEIFADAVTTSHTAILIGDLAKLLKQNGVETGQKRLFAWMRDNGYLIKRNGADRNMPTQRSMEMGLFEVKESTVNNPDGSVRINRTTKVTGKGQLYFINKFLQQ